MPKYENKADYASSFASLLLLLWDFSYFSEFQIFFTNEIFLCKLKTSLEACFFVARFLHRVDTFYILLVYILIHLFIY